MHVNTALGTLAHKGMNISTHIISSGLQSVYVKENGLLFGEGGDRKLTDCTITQIVWFSYFVFN